VGSVWHAYQALRVRALLDSPEAFTSTVERERGLAEAEWRRRLTASHTLIAWRDGIAVGTVAALEGDRPDGWAVVALWVDPLVRGGGLAGTLLDAVAEAEGAASIRRLRLWVMVDNAPARSLYSRRGWVATGDTERLPDGRDEIALELTLAR
jgi:GNAT superfamily N-acetyltransferase